MKRISAVIRVELGHTHDATEITPKDVIKLLTTVPLDLQEVVPLSVTYTDHDTGLIVREHHFGEEGIAE